MIIAAADQSIWQMRMLHELLGLVVRVLVAAPVSEPFHQAGGSVAQMERHRQGAVLRDIGCSGEHGLECGV